MIVGQGGQTNGQMTSFMVLQHSLRHIEGEAMAITIIHNIRLATIFFQHLLWCMKGQAMAMTIIRTI